MIDIKYKCKVWSILNANAKYEAAPEVTERANLKGQVQGQCAI